jgi:N utilization substance protein B
MTSRPRAGEGPAGVAQRAGVARSQARLAAVQALYQMDMAATDLNAVIHEFSALRFGPAAEADDIRDADAQHFSEVVRGVVARQREIDPVLDAQLAAGWRLTRIDSILRATLRAAVFELLALPGVPAKAAINEYVEVAKAFFEGDEPKVVNGVLDRIARRLRASEFDGAPQP